MAIHPNLYYEQRLLRIALDTATSNGYYFSESCEKDFRDEIDKAVKKMALEKKTEDEIEFAKAEYSTRVLVLNMISEMKIIGVKELRETSLRKALKSLCPLWPFC